MTKDRDQNFDIASLLRFEPPELLCAKCRAIWTKPPAWAASGTTRCPVCAVQYVPGPDIKFWEIRKYLRGLGLAIEFKDLISHSRELAAIAHRTRRIMLPEQPDQPRPMYSPMRGLFDSLLAAQHFVHFTTYGLSHMLLGVLKAIAGRVPVCGIVSNAEPSLVEELTNYRSEAMKLEVRLFKRDGRDANWSDAPHQKLLVVDGLLAFAGSANLTISGWRKAAAGRDVIEVITDVGAVIETHNRYFSPIWAEFDDTHQFDMEEEVPF